MADTSPTRHAIANTLWSLRTLGYRLDYVLDLAGNWRLYVLKSPRPEPGAISLSAPPKPGTATT